MVFVESSKTYRRTFEQVVPPDLSTGFQIGEGKMTEAVKSSGNPLVNLHEIVITGLKRGLYPVRSMYAKPSKARHRHRKILKMMSLF